MMKFFKILFSTAFIFLTALSVSAQSAESRSPSERKDKDEIPKSMKEMLVKKRIEQEKKDHEELIKKGDEALEISEQLEESFSQHNQLSAADKEKLDYLAGLVKKIRRGIGGEDDDPDPDDPAAEADDKESKPSTLEGAFKALQSTTVKLVDELKKTSRFTISAVAIQSSNALLRIVRFIRNGK